MAAEIWDLYDGCGEKTGRTMVRGEVSPTGFYHIGVHIWPMNGRGELLIQRRSMSVQWKPGIWAATGGSAVSGEEPLAAARRTARRAGLRRFGRGNAVCRPPAPFNSYCYVYAVKTDQMENEFSLQKEEVSAVRWCSPQRLMQMVAEGSMYNYGDAYYKLLLEFQRNNMRA